MRPRGMILSGGPRSVYEPDAPDVPIRRSSSSACRCSASATACSGCAQTLGGEVDSGASARVRPHRAAGGRRRRPSAASSGRTVVWMSHGDKVARLPRASRVLREERHVPVRGGRRPRARFYGVQFHPEVAHTVRGTEVLANFVLDVCRCRRLERPRASSSARCAKCASRSARTARSCSASPAASTARSRR
jgi:GMP synthase (glutamine-hydrolysing)